MNKFIVFSFVLLLMVVAISMCNGEEEKELEKEREKRTVLRSLVSGRIGRAKRRPNNDKNNSIFRRDPDKFLEKFGYLRKPPSDVQHSPKAREQAIRQFQRMAHIRVTGMLDEATLTKMTAPRCGMPDVAQPTVPDDPSGPSSGMASNFYASGNKWKKNQLTWKAINYSPDLYWQTQRSAFHTALKYWSDESPLEFSEISSGTPDIEIQFASGQHGDGAGNSFDGEGGVLAHAFYPEGGDTHFDEAEHWTDGTNDGVNLMIVAAHEFGHALGLGHSNEQGALMAPFYQGYDPNFQLHDDDVRGIQSIYGPRTRPPVTIPPPTTTRAPDTTSAPSDKPDTCTSKWHAIMEGQDYRIYIFFDKWMWRLDQNGVEPTDPDVPDFPRVARKYFQGPPYNPGATVYSFMTRYTYFFKGNRVWKYYDFKLVEKKTIRTDGWPYGLSAALMGRDGRIYLLKGADYWVFDETKLDLMYVESRPISAMWPGIPPNIEAAVRLRDGYLYFIKGSKYRKYDEYYRRVLPGYPKEKAGPWLGPMCSSGKYLPK